MNADTWTDQDELARRMDAVEAAINAAKLSEDRRGLIVGTRIALVLAGGVWTFVGVAAWVAFQ